MQGFKGFFWNAFTSLEKESFINPSLTWKESQYGFLLHTNSSQLELSRENKSCLEAICCQNIFFFTGP